MWHGTKVFNSWSSIRPGLNLMELPKQPWFLKVFDVFNVFFQAVFPRLPLPLLKITYRRERRAHETQLCCNLFRISRLLVFQDLANMIRFCEDYRAALNKSGQAPGRYLSVPAAEWFQGRFLGYPVQFPVTPNLQDCLQGGRRKIHRQLIWRAFINSGRKR